MDDRFFNWMMPDPDDRSGPVALLGSGEYLPVMDQTDAQLVASLGGRGKAHVVLIPTAAALEPSQPERWNELGLLHFRPIAERISALPLLSRADAEDERILEVLGDADLYYFSGGDPRHLIETMDKSPAWEIIRSRLNEGAAIAGCSAGAIMMGTYRVNTRMVLMGEAPSWGEALGVVPNLAVAPHFDRGRKRVGDEAMAEVMAKVLHAGPSDAMIAGIDEDTALVRLGNGSSWRWQVQGRQNVVLYTRSGPPQVFSPGDVINL
ncbi:MAG TPA: Type 1 glutamine amidotransferase-like domain-containing protein [Dehalococcoidia bacterium]|nr:Type 1 glutamine amidotransferase-like domain-containing protein [Dehalococcoidia bacterium]